MDDGKFGAFPGDAMDLDFMDELLFDGCWLETSDALDFLQSGSSSSDPVDDPSQYFPYSDGNTSHLNIHLGSQQQVSQEETKRKFTENQSLVYPKIEQLQETHTQNHQGFDPTTSSGLSRSFRVQGNESGGRWWIEQGCGTCLGVVEIVTTSHPKISCRPNFENVCKALEAVDRRSSENFSTSCVKACNELYHAAMAEIGEVLRSVCKTHKLPLALTWAPCVQERTGECHQSDENCARRFLTVDSACFVSDENLLGFLEACSEHHLLKGQGIVGKAFTLSKQCFTSDITAFSKSTYPLSHLARMFGLRAALAIPLRSTTTGVVECVLEFFLPKECQYTEEQNRMVNSLSVVIQQSCQSLQLAMEKELDEVILLVGEAGVTFDGSSPSKETFPRQSSWISHTIEAQQKGKGISVSWEHKKEEPNEEFKVTTQWDDAQAESYHKQAFPGFGQFPLNSGTKSSVEGGGVSSSPDGRCSIGSRKAGEKRQTKTEKTINLQVLSQYFAGSLKDAAKSIGVCPTTLKRICRQHGITRWPSRKIKKVGHSLKKLQLVIDSVQGSEGAIQIGSFYTSFPELISPNFTGNGPFSSMKTSDHSEPSNPQPGNGLFCTGAAVSKSQSSSYSQRSGSSTCCSTEALLNTALVNAMSCRDAQTVEDTSGILLKKAHDDARLLAVNQEEPNLLARSQSHKISGEHATFESLLPPLPKCRKHNLIDGATFRVKATFGEEKIRLSLQPNWAFKDLQQEIARRFNIEDVNKIELKYLDDDHEWILLTCDVDLEECIDIHKSYQSNTIKICLNRASHLKLGKRIHGNAPS